jgi:hypothetical protein
MQRFRGRRPCWLPGRHLSRRDCPVSGHVCRLIMKQMLRNIFSDMGEAVA